MPGVHAPIYALEEVIGHLVDVVDVVIQGRQDCPLHHKCPAFLHRDAGVQTIVYLVQIPEEWSPCCSTCM